MVLALAFLVGAKVANVSVPLLLKRLVDALDLKPGDPRALLVVPLGLLLGYGGAAPVDDAVHRAARDRVLPRPRFGAAQARRAARPSSTCTR